MLDRLGLIAALCARTPRQRGVWTTSLTRSAPSPRAGTRRVGARTTGRLSSSLWRAIRLACCQLGHHVEMAALDDLQAPDSRTLAFLPGGLGIDVQMTPEGAADLWSRRMERLTLHDDVAEGTRKSFSDLRSAFPYGLLYYPIFTLVHDRALFVLEQALRDRFIDFHKAHKGGVVPLRVDGDMRPVAASRFSDVREAGRQRRRKVELVISGPDGNEESLHFDAGLGKLLAWARRSGLLEGQRTRFVETAIKRLRDLVAHPEGYHLVTPVDAARTLSDLAEIINHLWRHDTPGGLLYPAPLDRQTIVLAWNNATGGSASMPALGLAQDVDWDEYSDFAIVQSPWPMSDDLHESDSWFETTTAPVDYLWGPGTRADALAWLDDHPLASAFHGGGVPVT